MTATELLWLLVVVLLFGVAVELVTTFLKNINLAGFSAENWGFHIALALSLAAAAYFHLDLLEKIPALKDLIGSVPAPSSGEATGFALTLGRTLTGLIIARASNWVHDKYRSKEPKPLAIAPNAGKQIKAAIRHE